MSKKPQKAAITQELMERLSQEAYCFNADHDTEIEALKVRIEEVKGGVDLVKKEAETRIAKIEGDKKIALGAKDDVIDDLNRKIKELEDRAEYLSSRETTLESELANAMVEAAKKFKDEAKCFDIFHKMIAGRVSQTLSIPELFAFSLHIIMSISPDGAESEQRFSVFMDRAMLRYADNARRALDMKRATDIMNQLRKPINPPKSS